MSSAGPKKPTKRPQIAWTRFWCPLGGTIHCGDDGRGFLTDPEGQYLREMNPEARRLEPLVPETGPLILCGDPGIGKTVEFRRLRSAFEDADGPQSVLALTFRLHISSIQELQRRTVESATWNQWKNGAGRLTLMIDGVDEGLIRIPTFISALQGLLEDEPVARLRLVLTCRSAQWPESQGNALISLWDRDEKLPKPIYELCPLRYLDMEQAAAAWGIDSDRFAAAIWRAQAVGMAARPVTLFLLLGEFQNHGRLPASHRELYDKGTRTLVAEVDPERIEILRAARAAAPSITMDERFASAQRLAALMLCCGRRSIGRMEDPLDHPDDESELVIEQCFALDKTQASAAHEAIESALFTSVGPNRFGFVHQTFAECLASGQLSTLPLNQVRGLLMRRDEEGEHVVPQLIELAAWTAGHHPTFFEHLLQTAPTTILHCDSSILADGMKQRLVAAILLGVTEGRILNDYQLYRFFHTLKHEEIASQLEPYISNKTFDTDSRRVAIEFAERCKLSEFTDHLLAIVADQSDPVREEAAEALCEIIPQTRLAELEPLARGEAGSDPKQSIRGYALRRLIPEHWGAKDALPHIPPRNDSSYYGAYNRFLDTHLPKQVRSEDVPDALQWLRSNTSALDSLSARREFVQRIIDLAIENLEVAGIAREFAQLWFALAKEFHISNLATTFGLKERLDADPDLKRELLSLLLNADRPADLHVWSLFDDLQVIRLPHEFDWLLDTIVRCNPQTQASWAEMIACYAYTPDLLTPCWDKFLLAVKAIPALGARFEWLRAWDLNEPLARQSKARHLKDKRQREKFEKRWRRDSQDPRPIREQALQKVRRDAPNAWYSLWHILHWGTDSKERTSFSSLAVEKYKGWNLLSQEEKELAYHSAQEFLLHFSENTDGWEPGSEASQCSTSAMWLLRDRLEKSPELAETLSKRWIPLFGAFHFSDEHEAEEIFAVLYRIHPQACISAMMADIEGDSPRIKRPFAVRVAKACWDDRLDQALKAYADTLTDSDAIESTIDEWREVAASSAGAYAIARLGSILAESTTSYPICLKALIVASIISRPMETFALAGELLDNDEHLAESVWSHVFHDIDVKGDGWWGQWTEQGLADLYLHLVRVLPRSGDPLRKDSLIAPRTSAAWERDRVPGRIADRSNRAACRALMRLIETLPDQASSLRWTYRRALIQCRKNEWSPPKVESALKLMENANARLIGSDHDLLEAVTESLDRLQHHLTGTTFPAVEELWNHVPIKGQRSRELQPKDEKVLQQVVARWLRDDLGSKRGIVVNCEVEPRLGSNTDIYVEAVRREPNGEFDRMTVVLEIKGCWHPHVRSAMHSQLVSGYLRSNGLSAGIYLIGWFVCDARPDAVNRTGATTIEEAKLWLSSELASYDGRSSAEIVSGFVLNCRWQKTTPSRTARST